MALAFSRRVAVLSALVAVLCVAALLARPAAGIRVATYFLDASVDPRNLAFSSVVNLPNDANSMLNTFIASNAATRMKQIAGLIDEDVFAFQNGVTVLRQTPATVFPATQVYADTVATLLSELHALGRDYTILGESLDFDISSPQVDPAVPDVTNKLRFKIRSGLAVRTALLPLLQWKSSGVFVSQQAITPVSPTLSPVYVGLGWQRAKIFLDGASWVITQAYFSDSSTPNAAQAGEIVNIVNTGKDEYAIFLGVINDPFGAFAVSTMSVGGFVSASAIANQPFPTCCLPNPFVAPQSTTLPPLFSTLDDIMLRTPRIQVSNFEVFTDNLSVYPLSQRIYPSSHLFVAARVLPLRQDGLPAAAVPLPLPAAPPPPKPVQRMDSSGSFEVVDIEYSQLSSVVQPPTVPGAYTPAPDQAYMRPDLPVATTTSAQAYEANAFIQQVRPLTHSASNDAVAVAASVFVTAILAVVACAMHM